MSRRTIHRRRNDDIPERQADTAAIRIGSHPAIIWPDHYRAAAA